MPKTLEDLRNHPDQSIFQRLEGKPPLAKLEEVIVFLYEGLTGRKVTRVGAGKPAPPDSGPKPPAPRE